jgi:hypothetical protein
MEGIAVQRQEEAGCKLCRTGRRHTLTVVATLGAALFGSSCGDCAGVGLSRLGETEHTIGVGQSFVATYEEGGSCDDRFGPIPNRAHWTTAETAIVDVDSVTGRITGKKIGDALVQPNVWITTGSWTVLVHVR